MKIPENPPNWHEIISKGAPDVFKLIADKKVFDFIVDSNNTYLHWDKLRRLPIPNNISSETIWAAMKMFRTEKYFNLNFNKFNFKYSLLPNTLKGLHILDKEAAGNLQIDDRTISRHGQERYIISALMEEAIASSQLEGAATTRKIAKEMLRQNRKPRDYSEKMILNGYKTLKMILEKKGEKLSKDFLLEIQKSITEGTLKNKNDEGRFRDNNETVVGDLMETEKVYHKPPNYEELPELVDELCKFANSNEGPFIHPIIKAIVLHFLIGYIHPFNDGNGRTARAIFYWYVIVQGYWLFEYTPISRKILESRTNYELAYLYTETDDNDLTYFIEFNVKVILKAIVDMTNYIKRKQKDQVEANKMLGELKDITFRQASILKEFMQSPNKYFTIKEIGGIFHIVYETARTDLMDLTKKRYLTMRTSKNKFVFIFDNENQNKINRKIKK